MTDQVDSAVSPDATSIPKELVQQVVAIEKRFKGTEEDKLMQAFKKLLVRFRRDNFK
jgi:hypothetical protein